MKLEIKNIKINNAFSEETICFIADIYANGKKIGEARNDGKGGSTDYTTYSIETRKLLEAAEKYALTLPPKISHGMTIESNLENLIDEAVYEADKQKELKRFAKQREKLMKTSILFGKPNDTQYSAIGFKGKQDLLKLIETNEGKAAILKLIERVKNDLKEGEVILNTNLPLDYLQMVKK